jgi:hypothetical protein
MMTTEATITRESRFWSTHAIAMTNEREMVTRVRKTTLGYIAEHGDYVIRENRRGYILGTDFRARYSRFDTTPRAAYRRLCQHMRVIAQNIGA